MWEYSADNTRVMSIGTRSKDWALGGVYKVTITCSMLALDFMHEIRETSDIRFMPESSLTNVSLYIPQTSFNEITTQL